jgi:AbrB family looped-hinge helix DNA binding protein
MHTARLSSKGQMVIPKEIREKAGLKPGDIVKLELLEDKKILIQPGAEPPSDIFAEAGSAVVEDLLRDSKSEDEVKIKNLLRSLGVNE